MNDTLTEALDGARENLAELVAWAGRWDRTFQEMGLKPGQKNSRMARARFAAPFVIFIVALAALAILTTFGV